MKSFFSISDPEKAATNSASRQCTYIHPSLPPSTQCSNSNSQLLFICFPNYQPSFVLIF